MAVRIVPELDRERWPTLAPQIIEFIEDRIVFGPGDMAGQPYKVSGDFEFLLYRAYEVYPRGHEQEGRRRFDEVVEDVRKGVGKTEHAAIVAICEAHPECPVRFDGWDARGEPVGRPMRHPFIPMLAYTAEQSEDLAYAAVRSIITADGADLADVFDVGLDRVLVIDEHGREAGKIAAYASAPDSRDGARTTFQHLDETHRMFSPRQKKAWTTMRQNVPKRRQADAWSFKSTTAPEPGQRSIAEDDRELADAVAEGKRRPPRRLFYFRRYCPQSSEFELPDVDDDTPKNRALVMRALVEASGPAAEWSGDLHAIVEQFFDPRADRAYLERVWLNRSVQGSAMAFDVNLYRTRVADGPIEPGSLVVATFDGSVGGLGVPDWTGLLLTDVATGRQQVAGAWWKPAHAGDDWEVPRLEVDAAVRLAFDEFAVWRLYADPHRWGPWLASWAGEFGDDRIVKWDTAKWQRMAWACHDFAEAIRTGEVSWVPGELGEHLVDHVGNARKILVPIWLDAKSGGTKAGEAGGVGEQLFTIGKAHPDRKIDLSVCGVMGRRAQLDAIAKQAKASDVKRKRATLRTF